MKIVEINTVCDTGSTGRIAAAVARLINEKGYKSYFAYGRGKHPDDVDGYKIGNKIDFLDHVLLNFVKGKSGFGSKGVTKRFLKWLDEIEPDVIHLHNIHGFYINIEMLFEYIKNRDIPTVWTLHDCWSFTGQCAHFDYIGCERWKTECYNCPIYRKEYPYSLFCDNSKNNYIEKKNIFLGVEKMVVVTPSKWLGSLVEESFLKAYPVIVINNGIDTGTFRPLCINTEKKAEILANHIGIKDIYDLSKKKIVLGVANVWSYKKGIDAFYRLSQELPKEYLIVLLGVSDKIKRNCDHRYSGRIIGIKHTDSIEELAKWYNIADVYVNPTLEDNYPTTNIEALACGTKVVTYDTGGSAEMITSNADRIIKKGDINGLVEAILEVTSSECADKGSISNAYSYLDASTRLAQYVDLFEKLVKNEEKYR